MDNSWLDQGIGIYYVDILVEKFEPDPPRYETCTTFETSTVEISYCIPLDATNISMSKLAIFFGLSSTNVLLSGPNNPSTSGSVIGQSNLPNTGSVSKSRPNAISELRSSCGGIQVWGFWAIKLAFGSTTATACQLGINATTTYYINNIVLTSTTSLWSNSTLTTKVTGAAGSYSNGLQFIVINTNGDVTSSGNCLT